MSDTPARPRHVPLWLILLIVSFTAAGLVLTGIIHSWGVAHDRKIAAIRSGEVAPTSFVVREKLESSVWLVPREGGESFWELLTPEEYAGVALGANVTGYRFGDEWLVPRFDTGGLHAVKWIVLTVALLPCAILAAAVVVRRRRSRTVAAAASVSSGEPEGR